MQSLWNRVNKMKTVSTTYELEHEQYIYRLTEDALGVIVRRVPVDNQLWSHGVISQGVDESFAFKSSCQVKLHKFKGLADAVAFIKR